MSEKLPFYTSVAKEDLAGIVDYIAQDNLAAALDYLDRIEKKCLLIEQHPAIGELTPRLGEGVRMNFVGRYVVFHRVSNGRVEILRFIPGDRDTKQL